MNLILESENLNDYLQELKEVNFSDVGIQNWIKILYGDLLEFDNMDNRTIHGTTEWNYYSIVLDVMEESAAIHFGVLLVGSEEVWIYGITFEEVDESVPSTNISSSAEELPLEPVNLGFDDL